MLLFNHAARGTDFFSLRLGVSAVKASGCGKPRARLNSYSTSIPLDMLSNLTRLAASSFEICIVRSLPIR